MKKKINLNRFIYIIGIIALVIGAVDPLEGSVLIAIGSIIVSVSAYFSKDKHRRIFIILTAMILIGVFFLFYLSSLGGFGGNSSLSWWYGILILPYPIAWLIFIVLIIIRSIKKKAY